MRFKPWYLHQFYLVLHIIAFMWPHLVYTWRCLFLNLRLKTESNQNFTWMKQKEMCKIGIDL